MYLARRCCVGDSLRGYYDRLGNPRPGSDRRGGGWAKTSESALEIHKYRRGPPAWVTQDRGPPQSFDQRSSSGPGGG